RQPELGDAGRERLSAAGGGESLRRRIERVYGETAAQLTRIDPGKNARRILAVVAGIGLVEIQRPDEELGPGQRDVVAPGSGERRRAGDAPGGGVKADQLSAGRLDTARAEQQRSD